jgi:tetratricopeptide (TPR) repeat protein
MSGLKPQRNDLCPCGSGKKFKRCCGQTTGFRSVAGAPGQRAAPTPIENKQLASMMQDRQYAEAERAARGMIDRYPAYGFAWKMLGVAQLLQGKNAVDVLRGAAALLPADAEIQSSLGNALSNLGRYEEAIVSCQRALALQPQFIEALNNLGNALANRGRLAEAVDCYTQAIRINPSYATAYCNLGNAQRSLGQVQESMASCRRAIEIQPRMADAYANLANAHLDLGQFEEAEANYRRALVCESRHAGVLNSLGLVLDNLGRIDEAAGCYWQALQINPNFAAAYGNFARVLAQLGRLNDALEGYRRALVLNPNDAQTYAWYAMTLRALGRGAEAEQACRKALEIQPNLALAEVFLGDVAADRGQFAQAEDSYRRAIAIDPDLPEAWIALGRHRYAAGGDSAWLQVLQGLLQKKFPSRIEIELHFSLGKYFDETGNFEEAFANYQRANELSKRQGVKYDRDGATQRVDRSIARYDAAWLAAAADAANDSDRPVFIIGMPRSGTTLAEQILAAHPAVFGAGESSYWLAAAQSIEAALDQGTESAALRAKISLDYLELLRQASPDASRVINKWPANYQHVGLIHAAFPKARFIHLQRDPIDTCLSIYGQNFERSNAYAVDLDDLAHEYREYLRLMAHWRAVLPAGVLLDVPYEALLADVEGWSRRMLEFIGLPWDPACLNFHEAQRTVVSPSNWQVRQPIYTRSVGRWRHYETFLGPLLGLTDIR